MELNLVAEGFKFMVLGMVTVFLFLILMVWVLNLQSKLINKFFPPKAVVPNNGSASKPAFKQNAIDDSTLVAVVTAAIQKHKDRKN